RVQSRSTSPDTLRAVVGLALLTARLHLHFLRPRTLDDLADRPLLRGGLAPLGARSFAVPTQLREDAVLLLHGLAQPGDERLIITHPAHADPGSRPLAKRRVVLAQVTPQLLAALLGLQQLRLHERQLLRTLALGLAHQRIDGLEALGSLHSGTLLVLFNAAWPARPPRSWWRRAARHWPPAAPAHACPGADMPRSAASVRSPGRCADRCRVDRHRW